MFWMFLWSLWIQRSKFNGRKTTQTNTALHAMQHNPTQQNRPLVCAKGCGNLFMKLCVLGVFLGYQNVQAKRHSLNETMKSNPDSRWFTMIFRGGLRSALSQRPSVEGLWTPISHCAGWRELGTTDGSEGNTGGQHERCTYRSITERNGSTFTEWKKEK